MFGKEKKEESLGAVGGLGLSKSNYDSIFDTEEDFESGIVKTKEGIKGDYRLALEDKDVFYKQTICDDRDLEDDELEEFEDEIVDAEYGVYENVMKTNLSMIILGNWAIGNSESKEGSACIDTVMQNNFMVVDNSNKNLGSILKAKDWNLFTNDMLVLGIIDSQTLVHLASQRHERNMLGRNDNKGKIVLSGLRLSFFARELIGLLCAGYKIKKLTDGTEVLSPPNKYMNMTLKQYFNAVNFFESTGEWKHLFNSNLKELKFNFKNNCLKEVVLK